MVIIIIITNIIILNLILIIIIAVQVDEQMRCQRQSGPRAARRRACSIISPGLDLAITVIFNVIIIIIAAMIMIIIIILDLNIFFT